MDMLIAGISFDRFHGFHPEMIAISPEGSDGLFEGHLDLEPESIQPDDFKRRESQVCGHENAFAPRGMENRHEANHVPRRAPDQID